MVDEDIHTIWKIWGSHGLIEKIGPDRTIRELKKRCEAGAIVGCTLYKLLIEKWIDVALSMKDIGARGPAEDFMSSAGEDELVKKIEDLHAKYPDGIPRVERFDLKDEWNRQFETKIGRRIPLTPEESSREDIKKSKEIAEMLAKGEEIKLKPPEVRRAEIRPEVPIPAPPVPTPIPMEKLPTKKPELELMKKEIEEKMEEEKRRRARGEPMAGEPKDKAPRQPNTKIYSPSDVCKYIKLLQNKGINIIYVDDANLVLGTIKELKSIKDIKLKAPEGTSAVIFVIQRPDAISVPSVFDEQSVTRIIMEWMYVLGEKEIDILDFIVLGKNICYSFVENGKLVTIAPKGQMKPIYMTKLGESSGVYLREATGNLKAGEPVGEYPEGTFTKGKNVLTILPGGLANWNKTMKLVERLKEKGIEVQVEPIYFEGYVPKYLGDAPEMIIQSVIKVKSEDDFFLANRFLNKYLEELGLMVKEDSDVYSGWTFEDFKTIINRITNLEDLHELEKHVNESRVTTAREKIQLNFLIAQRESEIRKGGPELRKQVEQQQREMMLARAGKLREDDKKKDEEVVKEPRDYTEWTFADFEGLIPGLDDPEDLEELLEYTDASDKLTEDEAKTLREMIQARLKEVQAGGE